MSAILPLKHLKRLAPQLWSLPLDPGHSNYSQADTSDYALTTVLSITTPDGWLAPYCIPLLDIFLPWNSITISITSYSQFLKLSNDVTLPWRLWTSNWCGHQSPEFAILFNDQNPHVLTSTLVWISFQFQPGNPFPSWKTWNQTWCTH